MIASFTAAPSPRTTARHRGSAQSRDPGQGCGDSPLHGVPAGTWSPAHRGHSRSRQDHPGPRAARRRSDSPTSASSSRATCCRRTSSASRSSIAAGSRFEFQRGPGLRAAGARGRSQSRDAQSAERAARGDGGTAGDRRRPSHPLPEPVLRHRDAEPRRAGRARFRCPSRSSIAS